MRIGGLAPTLCVWLLAVTSLPVMAAVERVEQALTASQRAAAESQQRVDGLDDATRKALLDYRAALLRAEQLRLYTRQLQAQVETQSARLDEVDAALGRLEESRAAMVPLLVRMSDTLEEFIAADQPFALESRRARLSDLRSLLADPEAGLADQYRSAYAAWQAEAGEGRKLAAERVTLPGSASGQLVDLLRVGRLALYALTLDANEAFLWQPEAGRFVALPAAALPSLRQALRVAQEQAAPSLLALPLEVR